MQSNDRLRREPNPSHPSTFHNPVLTPNDVRRRHYLQRFPRVSNDSAPQAPIPQTVPRGKELTKAELHDRVEFVKRHLDPHCLAAYSAVGRQVHIPFSLTKFASALESGPLDQEPGRPKNPGSSADASTDVDHPNGPGSKNVIHFWEDFYTANTPIKQGLIFWHEGTHRYFGLADYEGQGTGAPKHYSFDDQFRASGYPGINMFGTANFTDWLARGCPGPKPSSTHTNGSKQ